LKKLKLLIFIFCLAVSAPFIYFSLQANKNLEKEERAELQYFADKLFDEMEEELTSLIVKEEGRAIDAYNFNNTSFHSRENAPYILGYLQNNPDGSFQTPAARIKNSASSSRFKLMAQLKKINQEFNKKRSSLDSPQNTGSSQILVKSDKAKSAFEEKYLRRSPEKKRKCLRSRKGLSISPSAS